jgi:iron complex transport system ATP-binding protein
MSRALELADAIVNLAGRTVLGGVTLGAEAGEVVGLLGANGAGKTTVLRACLGLVPLDGGTARLNGDDVVGLSGRERARRVGYLPQERRIAWSLPAWRIAALGAVDQPEAKARVIAMEALAQVGLADLAERRVLDMSGGERARVLMARLLATRAPLLIADEPVAGLDPAAQMMICHLFRREARAGRAVVLTLHDLTTAARLCDRLVVLERGRVVAEGPPREALTADVLDRAFGVTGEWLDSSAGPLLSLRMIGL